MVSTWKEFYQEKSDRELYKIYRGNGRPSYDQRKLAQQILKERDFDFEHVEKYRDKWELEAILKEIEMEQNSIFFGMYFTPTYYLFGAVMAGIGCLFILIDLIFGVFIPPGESKTFASLLTFLIFLLFGGLAFWYYKLRKSTIKKRKLRFDELSRKLLK